MVQGKEKQGSKEVKNRRTRVNGRRTIRGRGQRLDGRKVRVTETNWELSVSMLIGMLNG